MENMQKPGCECGIKGCKGHEMVDGGLSIPNHPLGKIEIGKEQLADWHKRHGK